MGDTWVVVEHLEGKIADLTFEMLGAARPLATALGGRLAAVVVGEKVQDLAAQLGAADAVVALEHAALANYTPEGHRAAIAAATRELAPRLILVGNTGMGMDLAAGLSGELGLPLVAYCKGLAVEDGNVVATSQLYGGKVLVESVLEGGRGIVSVLAGSFPADPGQRAGSPPVESIAAAAPVAPRVRFRSLVRPQAGDVDITKEAVLVAVGRGIQSQDNIPLVEDLAKALGGALAASRPIVDSGWLPKTRQVGKSGMTVKPKLYVAVGISGAPEHLEGMRDAELIIAINPDASAPILEVAHYGIAGDLFEIVPALTERLTEGS